jgi:DNA-binding CsgD family transcriptional regulator
MSAPFVGRAPELEMLVQLAHEGLRARVACAAFVRGDPGSGKTRLLAEAIRTSRVPRSVRVAGFEPMQAVSLGAAGDLLRLLAEAPRTGAVLDDLAFGSPDATDRDPLRIFEAAHRALASSGPLLIGIDDVQWLDERTVALIHYLLRAASSARQPLAVIAASRPSPVAVAFRSSLEADLDEDHRAFINLGPLSRQAGRSLVRTIDETLGDAAAEELWRRANGSPFWLEALARGGPAGDRAQLIEDRLAALSGDGGAVLAALAIGARPFPEVEIAGVLDWRSGRVAYAVRELVNNGLGVDAGGMVRLAHDLIRESATERLPASTRRRLHARFAEWLEASSRDDLQVLREALEHRVAAGLPAASLAVRLLSSPQRRLIDRDGLRLIASISNQLEPSMAERLDIDRRLGELAGALGDPDLSLDRWKRVAVASDDPRDKTRAFVAAAHAAYRLRWAGEARANLDRARAVGAADSAVNVEMDALQAEIELWLEHDTGAGSVTARRSLSAARRMTAEAGGVANLTIEARRAALAAHEVAIDAALQSDRPAEVVRLSDLSVPIAEGLDTESYVASLLRPAFGLRTLGQQREAERRYREAWAIAEEHVLPMAMVEAGHGLGRVLRVTGRLTEAREIAAQTVDLEQRLGHPPRRWGNAPSILHLAELALGETSRLETLREDARNEPDPHYRMSVHQAVAAWRARLHGPRVADEVMADLEAARVAGSAAGCPRCSRELGVYTAEALARVGRPDEAQRSMVAWEAQGTSDFLMQRVWETRAKAAIARARGDETAAIGLLEGLVRDLERSDLVEDLLWLLIDLGNALSASDRRRSIEVLTAAASLADETGAKSQGRLAIQALRRIGVRAWRRGRAGGSRGLASLSAREAEVAGLVADGNSNGEIAELLALSPKTVERHVTNALAKLGLRNRTELAALVRSPAVRDSPDDPGSPRRLASRETHEGVRRHRGGQPDGRRDGGGRVEDR